jgi:mRNA deadenylase 3'-5' endonuclease subunit Ccr4
MYCLISLGKTYLQGRITFSSGKVIVQNVVSKVLSLRKSNIISSYTPLHTIDGPHLNRAVLWVDKDGTRHNSSMPVAPNSFKIVTYNVLGPLHGELKNHGISLSVSKWTRRRDYISDHLLELNSDVYCLQEVTGRSLKETFIPKLQRLGLELVGFAPARRHGNHHHGHSYVGHKYIGTAIFCKVSKFDVLDVRRVILRDFLNPLLSPSALNDHSNLSPEERVSLKELIADCRCKFNSMMLTRLRLKSSLQEVVIANAHMCWHPKQTDVKVLQTASAISAIDAFVLQKDFNTVVVGSDHTKYGISDDQDEEDDNNDEEEDEERARSDEEDSFDGPVHPVSPLVNESTLKQNAQENSQTTSSVSPIEGNSEDSQQRIRENAHIIFCGDFNMDIWSNASESNLLNKPNITTVDSKELFRSGIADLLTNKEVSVDHPHHPFTWRNKRFLSDRIGSLKQPYSFNSLYEIDKFSKLAPAFSTKTQHFEGRLDHIWCSSNIGVHMVLKPPVTISDDEEKRTTFPVMPNKVFPSDHLPIGAVVTLQ